MTDVETHARAIVAALTLGAMNRSEMIGMFVREEMGTANDVDSAISWASRNKFIAHGLVSRGARDWPVRAWYVTYKGKQWIADKPAGPRAVL